MSAERDDGGPAFPIPDFAPAHSQDTSGDGMSLRDYFAAAALQGILAKVHGQHLANAKNVAADAYHFADAMIEARRK